MTINEIQDDIINEFSLLSEDLEMATLYIMESGEKLEPIGEKDRTEENLVKGCQSKVWLVPSLKEGKVFFGADSNAAITKGLVYLLVRIFNGKTPDEIIDAELYFIDKIGMNRFIGTQRSNGFAAMIKQMKLYALAFKSQIEA